MSKVIESFPTRLGSMEATWEDGVLTSMGFSSEPSQSATLTPFARSVQDHFEGGTQDFTGIQLDTSSLSEFTCEVYRATRAIPAGQVKTYGEIATAIGRPGSARAVGAALGRNPFLLIVPCHRVTASGGSMRGFSAPGGVRTKELMLACEGFGVESLWCPKEMERALDQLSACPLLGPVTDAVGPPTLTPLLPHHPFGALVRSVLYQQIATAAASAIQKRVERFGDGELPTAQVLADLDEDELRKAGVSTPKRQTLKRLAEATLSGSLRPQELHLLPNSVVIEEITKIKGLGPWSAQMFLLFHLGRRDIFAPTDLGIMRAVQRLLKKDAPLSATEMMRAAKRWAPYRSLASWYLWRSTEL